ncbi:fimbrial protein [Aeromonas salmonicida]|uniref:Type 1 fimbrial protein n=1 Tax=Escherichia coli TaxID=562 RepID=A0A3L0VYL6_ECOLX|nr:fimbrial protein [Aeromonas salmonicida]MDR6995222.1 type 1 fimbria pilin [Aeromonas salmonicida]MDR7020383.1 type 1 fimbria pilin [Aeromonas salmonicida]PBO12979.1 fimbrial protein [Aeromonas salmonicida]HEH9414003.1 type 1 fimbrial protein [Aeromonas salmonicida]HEH9421359.1 type 1 fimbrial protein [Aeromonas salmonicida]
MNANKILVAMGVGSMLLCGSAVAAGSAGSGKVTFNGEIINAPCSVAPESVDQVVEMGQISTKELVKGGESKSRPFSIKLLNCEITPDEDAVKVTFSGAKDPVDSSLLVIGGGQAAGAGIKMTAPGGAPIVLGTPTSAFGLVNGDNELPFSAVLKGYADQTANPLTAGAFTAVTNFTLSYE